MARFKPIDTSPRFLAVDLYKQLLPGSLACEVLCVNGHAPPPQAERVRGAIGVARGAHGRRQDSAPAQLT